MKQGDIVIITKNIRGCIPPCFGYIEKINNNSFRIFSIYVEKGGRREISYIICPMSKIDYIELQRISTHYDLPIDEEIVNKLNNYMTLSKKGEVSFETFFDKADIVNYFSKIDIVSYLRDININKLID